MTRICLIGPTYPYRGGIAHYTTLLAEAFRQEHETLLISFSRQYPSWLFPGKSDRDPSQQPLSSETEYLLDSINPLSWEKVIRRIAAWEAELVIIPWWVPFWAPIWRYISWRLKQLSNPPRLLFVCHNVLPHEPGMFDRFAARIALAQADGCLVHAQSDSKKLTALLPKMRQRLNPLPTYGAIGKQSPPASLQLPEQRPLLLFFGLVRPYKGLDILLAALPLIRQEIPVHLLVAGEFWQSSAPFEAQIAALKINDHVTLIDQYLPDEEAAACFQAADLVVLPYRSATQSAVVQMAFGYERPVVTTAVGGLAEAVHDGQTGFVVPPENPAALAAAIVRYFNEDLKEMMQANIDAENNGRFSWQQLITTLLDLAEIT